MSFFSKLGENIILPQDVLIQSKETAAVAGAINATIGIASANKIAMALPSINKVITEINNSEFSNTRITKNERIMERKNLKR